MSGISRDSALTWLRREIDTALETAVVHRVIAGALQPHMAEFAGFTTTSTTPPNMQAVRAAVDHRTLAEQSDVRARMMSKLLVLATNSSAASSELVA